MATKATKRTPAKDPGPKGPAKKDPGTRAPARKEPPSKAPAKKEPPSKKPALKAKAAAKAKAPARAKASGGGKTVEGYVAKLGRPLGDVVSSLRELIHEAAPQVTESIKWAQPVYEANGPFAFIKAFRTHVNFGFWRGAELPDPEGVLAGGGDRMRHVKLTKPDEIRKPTFLALVREAVRLNQELGDPTKRRG